MQKQDYVHVAFSLNSQKLHRSLRKYPLKIFRQIIAPNIQHTNILKMVDWTDISSDLHLVCSSGHHLVALVFSAKNRVKIHMDLTLFCTNYV